MATRKSAMTLAREQLGLALADVAAEVGTDKSNLAKVERGEHVPRRDLARKLFVYYGRSIPLGLIYDPFFEAA